VIRVSEMVLSGHPDKFCDQIADAIVGACMAFEPEAYCQVEVAAWGDEVWLNGGIATEGPIPFEPSELVHVVSDRIGYGRQYRVHSAVCVDQIDPRRWTRKVNDQAICVGWAGYDERTAFLPPEHFLAHMFRLAIEESIAHGVLKGEGPDGKLLLRVREEGAKWRLEHLLVTLQQRESTEFMELTRELEQVLSSAYGEAQRLDPRWSGPWNETVLLINPNGPLVSGGSDGDNGQTGRKLVMDYYGPRVGIGGGALSGKHLSHIDRAGAYAAREAAVKAVASGAKECRVVVSWAPNSPQPLEVIYEMEGRGTRQPDEFFNHDCMRERLDSFAMSASMPRGDHFLNRDYRWNRG